MGILPMRRSSASFAGFGYDVGGDAHDPRVRARRPRSQGAERLRPGDVNGIGRMLQL
jgi:hypothetical protein